MSGAADHDYKLTLRQRVLWEQLKEHDKILVIVLVANFLVGVLCFLMFVNHVPLHLLQLWLVSLVGALLFYWGASWRFSLSDSSNPEKWITVFTLRAGFNGSAWCGLTFLMPSDGVYVGITCAVVTGLVGGAVGSSVFFPAMIAFTIPATLGLSLNLFILGNEPYSLLALAVLIYLVVSALFSKTIEKNFLNFLWLRLKNEALVESLQQQKELAEKANVDKSRFLAAASHDLRQPLHALGLFLNLLKKKHQGLDENLMENIRESMNALKGLFDSLLDISRLDAGMVKADMQPVSLGHLFGLLKQEFQPLVAQKGLELRVFSTSMTVLSDPNLLESILRNLLTNAVRYTNQGKIVLGCRSRGDKVSIEVLDTGIGIPKGMNEKVFEEYFQVGNQERDRSQGLGLGLSIVKREAKLLGHELVLDSKFGKGTKVAIMATKTLGVQEAERSEPVRMTDAEICTEGCTVLVVEDEIGIRNAMAALFEESDCRAVIVENEADACVRLKAEGLNPDFIISDLRLRDGRTGIEAIDMVRSVFQREIPAVLVTGDTSTERLKEAQEAGLRLLHKPVEAEQLLDELRQGLHSCNH